ncbi:uncharacterized protein ARMOST_15174 [Armillaria ostoyae]|uniref:Uncharacterized protein n=1 Tax=Armillaria ostoyae TaxID=47428 RepID=A0A284RST1_ARMOS|nr:uncharacterized protein ARMOST_15174 [Armillaria ostoyae]
MHQCGWSAAATAKALEKDFPALFSKLHKGTIQRWKVKGVNQWTDKTLLNVKNQSVLEGSERFGILTPYPETIKEINTALLSLRMSGIPVNVSIGRSLIWAIVKERHPELLSTFKISECWVQLYYKSNLKWSPQKATRAAAHIPENAGELCLQAFFHLVYAIKWENIPPELIINVDQQGV